MRLSFVCVYTDDWYHEWMISWMNGIMKVDKSHEVSDLLIKYGSETIKNEAEKTKHGFLSMLLCTLGASLLRNM